jgi:hypothetical protein
MPKLHLDADASQKSLQAALLARGHNVTESPGDTTPQPGLPLDASDEYQLLWATAQGRIIFTHNIRDFIHLTDQYPQHAGILLCHRSSFRLRELIDLLDRILETTQAEEWVGQVRWLTDWR